MSLVLTAEYRDLIANLDRLSYRVSSSNGEPQHILHVRGGADDYVRARQLLHAGLVERSGDRVVLTAAGREVTR